MNQSTTGSAQTPGTFITLPTVVQLVQNFVDGTYKSGNRKLTIDQDAHAVHFPKSKIDELFARNGFDPSENSGADYGMRIYLGMHQNTAIENAAMPNLDPAYIGQHTVVLVATKHGQDLIGPGTADTALDEGHLCPPPKCAGPVDDGLIA